MKRLTISLTMSVLLLVMAASTRADIIGGIDFPDGVSSFADSVYSYTPGTNVGPGYNVPTAALGVPDYSGANNTSVSLGIGGVLILQFTDNALTTSGNGTPDLHIFEIGGVTEWMNVDISVDASTWIDVGDVLGQPTSINIDGLPGVIAGAQYSFVRIGDIGPNQSGYPFGEADIDAVGAISSVVVPVPGAVLLGMIGLSVAGIKLRKPA